MNYILLNKTKLIFFSLIFRDVFDTTLKDEEKQLYLMKNDEPKDFEEVVNKCFEIVRSVINENSRSNFSCYSPPMNKKSPSPKKNKPLSANIIENLKSDEFVLDKKFLHKKSILSKKK